MIERKWGGPARPKGLIRFINWVPRDMEAYKGQPYIIIVWGGLDEQHFNLRIKATAEGYFEELDNLDTAKELFAEAMATKLIPEVNVLVGLDDEHILYNVYFTINYDPNMDIKDIVEPD